MKNEITENNICDEVLYLSNTLRSQGIDPMLYGDTEIEEAIYDAIDYDNNYDYNVALEILLKKLD